MSQYPEDIRVVKSKKALMRAMRSLLRKRSFQKITVNDLCREAKVSRSTFYVHFEDKYELMCFMLEEFRKQMEDGAESRTLQERVRSALQTIKDNAAIFQNLLKSDPNRELVLMFHQYFSSNICETLTEQAEKGTSLPADAGFIASFYAGGIAMCIGGWIESGFKQTVEEFAANLHGLLQGSPSKSGDMG